MKNKIIIIAGIVLISYFVGKQILKYQHKKFANEAFKELYENLNRRNYNHLESLVEISMIDTSQLTTIQKEQLAKTEDSIHAVINENQRR